MVGLLQEEYVYMNFDAEMGIPMLEIYVHHQCGTLISGIHSSLVATKDFCVDRANNLQFPV